MENLGINLWELSFKDLKIDRILHIYIYMDFLFSLYLEVSKFLTQNFSTKDPLDRFWTYRKKSRPPDQDSTGSVHSAKGVEERGDERPWEFLGEETPPWN